MKYWAIDLIFYAVVPKHGELNCWLVKEAVALFKDLKFSIVEHEDFGEFKNKEIMMAVLKKISWEVTENPIEKDQEGCVVYFEGEHNQKLCKVKTLEYRIYRKLREKLKKASFVDHEKLLTLYKIETQSLVGEFQTPKSLGYYFKLASLALNLAA